jgi:hypothetical protein
VELTRTLKPHELIEVIIERLADDSISVRATNRSTLRVLFDRAFVAPGGLETIRLTINRQGIVYEAS